MNQTVMMQRLLWKDVKTLQPLLLTVVGAIVLVNALLFVVHHSGGMFERNMVAWTVAMWVGLPGLLAFGAPAMLVGGEEDAGTLGWLRTLPVSWHQVAGSKFLVALVSFAGVWLLAAACLVVQSFDWSAGNKAEALQWENQLASAYYLSLLLVLGFVISYLVRSPMAALLILMPVFMFVAIAVTAFAFSQPLGTIAVTVGALVLVAGWGVQHLLARRRMLSPRGTSLGLGQVSLPIYRYRLAVDSAPAKPSVASALLWQQVRQTWIPSLAITLGCGVLIAIPVAMVHGSARPPMGLLLILGGTGPLFFVLGATWLGSLVFYGDTLKRRCAFFADRGLSAGQIWWTRMLPQVVALALMLGFIALVGLLIDSGRGAGPPMRLGENVVVCCVMFAFGQLVSQWTERPVLAFLAAPAYAFVTLVPAFSLLDAAGLMQGSDFPAILLIVPVLLLASWRLMRPWLDGCVGVRYTARVLGYTALAILLPSVWALVT